MPRRIVFAINKTPAVFHGAIQAALGMTLQVVLPGVIVIGEQFFAFLQVFFVLLKLFLIFLTQRRRVFCRGFRYLPCKPALQALILLFGFLLIIRRIHRVNELFEALFVCKVIVFLQLFDLVNVIIARAPAVFHEPGAFSGGNRVAKAIRRVVVVPTNNQNCVILLGGILIVVLYGVAEHVERNLKRTIFYQRFFHAKHRLRVTRFPQHLLVFDRVVIDRRQIVHAFYVHGDLRLGFLETEIPVLVRFIFDIQHACEHFQSVFFGKRHVRGPIRLNLFGNYVVPVGKQCFVVIGEATRV